MPPIRLPRQLLSTRITPILTRTYASPATYTSPSQIPTTKSKTDEDIAAKKNAQAGNADADPTRIDRQSQEYGLSGTDDAVAQDDQVSFQRGSDPEASRVAAGRNNDNNPLQVSPANPDASLAGTEYVNAVEYRPEKGPTTTKSQGKAKTRVMRDADVNEEERVGRAFAGADKRKDQSPREVANKGRFVSPGSR